MKLLLLCLGLTLVCADHKENYEVVRSNFDMSKISGEWYTILLASDVKEKVEEEGSLRLFVENTQVLDNSSLLIKKHKKVNGECTEMTFISEETEEKGVYGVPYDGYTTFYLVEAVYNDYFILYALNSKDGEKTQLLELSARNPDVSLELKERFEEIREEYGISEENVLDVTNADRCLQARGS